MSDYIRLIYTLSIWNMTCKCRKTRTNCRPRNRAFGSTDDLTKSSLQTWNTHEYTKLRLWLTWQVCPTLVWLNSNDELFRVRCDKRWMQSMQSKMIPNSAEDIVTILFALVSAKLDSCLPKIALVSPQPPGHKAVGRIRGPSGFVIMRPAAIERYRKRHGLSTAAGIDFGHRHWPCGLCVWGYCCYAAFRSPPENGSSGHMEP